MIPLRLALKLLKRLLMSRVRLTPFYFKGYASGIPRCTGVSRMARNDLQGSLDLLVLKTLSQTGSLHGYGIVLHIQRASDALLNVEEGSLYPALHRMEQSGWIRSEWALTETGRKAKYYKLTAVGRKQLEEAEKSFEQLVKGIRAILRYA